MDPRLYARDDYVATLKSIPSVFWAGCAKVIKTPGLSLETVFLGLSVISLVGLYSATFWLALCLTESRRAAWISLPLLLVSPYFYSYCLLSQDIVFANEAHQTSMAWPLWLWALALWLRGSKNWASGIIGVAFNLNPFISASLLLCLLVMEILGRESWQEWIRTASKPFVVFLASSFPTWVGIPFLPSPRITSREWASILREFYPFVAFPSSWGYNQWLYILAHGSTLASLYAIGFSHSKQKSKMTRFGAAVGIIWIVYAFFAEIVPCRPIILFEAYRLDGLMVLLSLIGAASLMDRLCSLGCSGWALCGLIWTSLGSHYRALLPLPLIVPLLAHWAWQPAALAVIPGWACWYLAALFVAGTVMIFSGFPWKEVCPLPSAIFLPIFAGLILMRRGNMIGHRWKALPEFILLGASLLCSFVTLGASHGLRKKRPVEIAFHHQRLQLNSWLRENTPRDSLILTWPYLKDLRTGAARSVILQLQDGAAIYWKPDFAYVWRDRAHDIIPSFEQKYTASKKVALCLRFPIPGCLPRQLSPSMQTPVLDPRVIRKYNPDYVVWLNGPQSPDLKFLTSIKNFSIYKVLKSVH